MQQRTRKIPLDIYTCIDPAVTALKPIIYNEYDTKHDPI